VALGQQAGETDARSAGREMVGSTLMGAWIAALVWLGLSLWPVLWMLMLWLMAAALWSGSALFRARRSRFRPSFWSNALITALILLGPAIEDSASGKSVLEGSVMRTCLFLGVAFYAWGTFWALERWRARGLRPADTSTG
jgi:FtsH-binding integral membrane protein